MNWPPDEEQCPECGYHWSMPAAEAIDLVDLGTSSASSLEAGDA
ncbi:MAG TPA: hypothetical protein VK217_01785 [Acidimicrobiales bacterium]|nr:hypothetical protein [Acidimicrobiales bacterium]